MTRKDQRRIIREMSTRIRQTMMEAVPKLPEEWDGLELRQLFADKAAEFVWRPMERGRKMAYRNEVITRNL